MARTTRAHDQTTPIAAFRPTSDFICFGLQTGNKIISSGGMKRAIRDFLLTEELGGGASGFFGPVPLEAAYAIVEPAATPAIIPASY